MAKRKLYPVERTVLRKEVDVMKGRKDWLLKNFIEEVTMLNESIDMFETILRENEVEEGMFGEV